MAMRNEKWSTEEIEKDVHYNYAATTSYPATEHLAVVLKAIGEQLREKRLTAEQKELAWMVAQAQFNRVDFDVNEVIRKVELKVQAEVKKDRGNPKYRACFPKGLSLIALKGQAEAAELEVLGKGLKQHFPALWSEHGAELEALAKRAVAAEEAAAKALREAEVAKMEERLARGEAVKQLRRNEGALLMVFPGERAKVRSFFRQINSRVEDEAQPSFEADGAAGADEG